MVNEVIEVKKYLDGDGVTKTNLYRACYLMAKWYKEQGLTKLQIREAIFSWGKKNKVFIKYNVNNIINAASADKRRLANNMSISVSEEDVAEINHRFDKPRVKLVALAMLCYAKAFANQDGEFNISYVDLASWVGATESIVRKSYVPELIEYEYMSVVQVKKAGFSWNDKNPAVSNTYRLRVQINQTSNTVLHDNEIRELFEELF